ncbi:MAG: hypothetical protein WCJ95_19860, partial [Mariniphaga sp.]
MKTILRTVSIFSLLFLMLHYVAISQESRPIQESQQPLKALLEKQQTPLVSGQKELYNLNGVIWHRDCGEREYYLTSVVRDKKEFKHKVTEFDAQTKRYRNSPLKKIKIAVTGSSKKILADYCINIPEYMTESVNVLIPEKALAELAGQNIPYQAVAYGKAMQAIQKSSDAPASLIWSEGFEGSLSPYSRNYYSGSTSCYWGDVNCFAHSGNWSLWCADDGNAAPSAKCSNYVDNMDCYVFNVNGIYVGGYTDVHFSYWMYYDMENTYDNTYHYYYDGSNWILVDTYTGNSGGWVQKTWILTGFTSYQWDFEFQSDYSNSNYYGFYL